MTWYRVKIPVKVAGDVKETQRRRSLVKDLIEKHGGKDDSPARPGAKFVVAIFSSLKAMKGFRDEARQAIAAA